MIWTSGILALFVASSHGFSIPPTAVTRTTVAVRTASSKLHMTADRRDFLSHGLVVALGGAASLWSSSPSVAGASVYLDPAMYGDQENRVAAVDTLREKVRRAILQDPPLAPAFYQLALMDGLSYNFDTKEGGPDGAIVKSVFSSTATDDYTKRLQAAAQCLIESTVALKRMTAITLADAIALGGAEAIQSIGGPVVSVQLGRTDAPKTAKPPALPLELLSGKVPPAKVLAAFKSAGLTEREMTALLGALLTISSVEKSRSTEDWRQSVKPKYRERGKIGRMSDYKRLTDEDIANMEEDYDEDPDDGWYIADSFGTRDDAFGQRIGKDEIDQKSFNRYLKDLNGGNPKSGGTPDKASFGWIASVLLDKNSPTSQAWLNKYASSNLTYLKDLGVAYNAVTQLGAEYTGGKYENLLKNKPRKSLNDDDLGLF